MKNICIFILFLSFAFCGLAQSNSPRSTSSVTAVDQRLSVPLNFYMPRYTDTTVANIAANIGLDSISGMIYTRTDGKVWVRKSSPKRWVEVGAGAAIDTLLISTRAWRQKGVDSLKQLIPTNNNQLTNGAGYITSFAATLKAVTRTLDTINANTTIVLNQSNFDAFTLRNSANTNSISLNESATQGAYTSILTSTFGLVNQINTQQKILLSTRKASNSNKGGIVNVSASNPFVEIGGDTLKLKNSLYAAQSIGATGSNLFPYEPVTADTTNYKPLALNSVNGVLIRLDKWPSSSGTGTVTSIATNTGSGIKGGTITTTGTLSIDTGRTAIAIVTGGALNKVKDSLQANIDLKQNLLVNSAGLLGALSDETGAGLSVFNNTPTITTPTIGAINGGTAANDDITIQGTTNAARTTSYVNLQPNGGVVGIGTASPGSLLDIIGSSGAANNVRASIKNNNAAGDAQLAVLNAAGHYGLLFKTGASYITYKTIAGNDLGFYNSGAGNISVLNDISGGKILFTVNANSTPSFSIAANGSWSNTGSDAVASATLELASTTKGFLPPRMTKAQRDAISSPAEGLEIYNTTTHSKDIYNGINWPEVIISSASTLTLTHGSDYFFTGTTTTWTMPAVSASLIGRGSTLSIKNMGSGAITLNSNTGTTLYTTAAVGTITINPGDSYILMPNGTYFSVQ